MKKILLFGLLLAVILTFIPAQTKAQTVEELQRLIAQLQAQINALLGQQQQQGYNEYACYNYTRDLTIGSTGNDVIALQKYLIQQKYLIISPEIPLGYFGATTKGALARYQMAVGINNELNGYGYFGPITRGHLATKCVTPPSPQQLIWITAPNGGESYQTGKALMVTWLSKSTIPATQPMQIALRHYLDGNPLGTNYRDYVFLQDTPNDGDAGSVMFFPAGIYKLQIKTNFNGQVYEDWSDTYFKVYTSDPTPGNLPPVVRGVSGPSQLKVGEEGKWSVTAADPESGSLYYSVDWGDGAKGVVASTPAAVIDQTATFTHVYASAGTYKPLFTVTDQAGLSARSSLSVVVGDAPTTSAQLPKLKLVSTEITKISGDVTNDQAMAEFVFDATAIGDTLYQPKASDFIVAVDRNGAFAGHAIRSISVSPDKSSIPSGETYRIALTANYIADVDGLYRFSVAGGTWRYAQKTLSQEKFIGYTTDTIYLDSYNIPPTQPTPSIISSNPPNGAVDARSVGNESVELYEIGLDFSSSDDSVLNKNNYSVSSYPFDAPEISSIRWAYGNNYAVTFGTLLKPGTRIRLTHKPSNTSVCVGSLPGDHDGNGFVQASDIGALRARIADGSAANLPTYRTDINRDGVVNDADWQKIGEIYSEPNSARSLPACSAVALGPNRIPSVGVTIVDLPPDPTVQYHQLANSVSATRAILEKIKSLLGN